MRILKFIINIFFKRKIYEYKNLSYMEASIGLVEDDMDDI